MASYLVVANRTLAGESLAAHLRTVIADDPAATFTVVVPVPLPVSADLGGAMSGIPVLDPEIWRDANSAAQKRLEELLGWLDEAGASAQGSVMMDGPMAAMERASRAKTFDHIIISTMPAGVSRWLRMDLVHRANRRFRVPITTIVGTSTSGAEMSSANSDAAVTATAPIETRPDHEEHAMGESVYKIIELVGTSTESWEKAATAAVTTAARNLRDLRVAEVVELDLVIEDGAVTTYRAKVKVSFKYEDEG